MTWFGERPRERAQIPATKEPIGLSRSDGKRPVGATLIPWKRGKPLAWDVIVPDTYAASHIGETSWSAGAAANKAAINKTAKYNTLATTHYFIPIARNWRTLELRSLGIHLRIWQKNHTNHTGTFEDTISVPKAVNITVERKWNSVQKHFHNRVIFVPGSVPFQTSHLIYNL